MPMRKIFTLQFFINFINPDQTVNQFAVNEEPLKIWFFLLQIIVLKTS